MAVPAPGNIAVPSAAPAPPPISTPAAVSAVFPAVSITLSMILTSSQGLTQNKQEERCSPCCIDDSILFAT